MADRRIAVTVLTGFLGSGKTTLLNRLVCEPAYAGAAVIVNEFGDIGVDHHLVRAIDGRIVLLEGGCICCSASGGLADTLRDLFMLALRRQIRPFAHVLVETTGLASPAAIMFTLRHDAFLAERFVYQGSIAVADVQHVGDQLRRQPEAAQQIALADVVALSKADLCAAGQVEAARQNVEAANPGVPICVLRRDGPLDELLLHVRPVERGEQAMRMGRWLGAFGASRLERHPGLSHFSMTLSSPISRGAFLAGMHDVQATYDQGLLRMKGLVCFEGEALPCAVHGVHRQLYPLEMLPEWPGDSRASSLVFLMRGHERDAVLGTVRKALHQSAP
ncbi:Uncharacterized GTP-binding protein YjiA [Bordetella ansorpii]|uniref:Uncharacterized GTP-binding protein YjiA n=1 Tax=Bordetella ansorpii TaxID=288768 RepID=A0A157SP78_9BORD|nr:GTP-binding protein [Bordetella ansorpii]SAI72185.1 Uncharacterized GTP-binding protein YjiA [Bordetella ansorpii]